MPLLLAPLSPNPDALTRAVFVSFVDSNERRDEGRNTISGGAARMAQLLEEHNAENFPGGPPSAANPTSLEK